LLLSCSLLLLDVILTQDVSELEVSYRCDLQHVPTTVCHFPLLAPIAPILPKLITFLM
jgi:hypothetical protein